LQSITERSLEMMSREVYGVLGVLGVPKFVYDLLPDTFFIWLAIHCSVWLASVEAAQYLIQRFPRTHRRMVGTGRPNHDSDLMESAVVGQYVCGIFHVLASLVACLTYAYREPVGMSVSYVFGIDFLTSESSVRGLIDNAIAISTSYFFFDTILIVMCDLEEQWQFIIHHVLSVLIGMSMGPGGPYGISSSVVASFMTTVEMSNLFISVWDMTKRRKRDSVFMNDVYEALTPWFASIYVPFRAVGVPYYVGRILYLNAFLDYPGERIPFKLLGGVGLVMIVVASVVYAKKVVAIAGRMESCEIHWGRAIYGCVVIHLLCNVVPGTSENFGTSETFGGRLPILFTFLAFSAFRIFRLSLVKRCFLVDMIKLSVTFHLGLRRIGEAGGLNLGGLVAGGPVARNPEAENVLCALSVALAVFCQAATSSDHGGKGSKTFGSSNVREVVLSLIDAFLVCQ
jgi:hypothetical protein